MGWNELATELFPEDHPDVGGWCFSKIYEQRPDFVKYVRIMYDVTGLYKIFQQYVNGRYEHEQASKKLEKPPKVPKH